MSCTRSRRRNLFSATCTRLFYDFNFSMLHTSSTNSSLTQNFFGGDLHYNPILFSLFICISHTIESVEKSRRQDVKISTFYSHSSTSDFHSSHLEQNNIKDINRCCSKVTIARRDSRESLDPSVTNSLRRSD